MTTRQVPCGCCVACEFKQPCTRPKTVEVSPPDLREQLQRFARQLMADGTAAANNGPVARAVADAKYEIGRSLLAALLEVNTPGA